MSQQETAKPAAQGAEAAPPRKRRWLKWTLLGVIVLLLLGGGGTGLYLWRVRAAPPEGEAGAGQDQGKAPARACGVLVFEPFVVNLADKEGSRFLRVNLRLLIDDGEAVEELQKDEVAMLKIRSGILELLSAQTSDKLVTAEGKTALKSAIAERAGQTLDKVKVTDVLFSEFVVQF
jgi:flagellar basal body-associated protein FliL